MPRQPRLDAPGTLHHVMGRGIERTKIFQNKTDGDDFLNRLAELCQSGYLIIYAWVLMDNHFHLLVRTGNQSISTGMRKLLTGYVVNFNRRHKRYGHLFQNRYKSIICEDDPYLLELTRYIHLNPLRGGIVKSLRVLGNYPWSGHAVVMGKMKREWQDTDAVLAYFGRRRREAIKRYEEFIKKGVAQGRRDDLMGGGLARSSGGWSQVLSLRSKEDKVACDERVLGSSEFVQSILSEAGEKEKDNLRLSLKKHDLSSIAKRIGTGEGIEEAGLRSGNRRKELVRSRKIFCQLAVKKLGYSGAEVARYLGVTTSAVNRMANAEVLPKVKRYIKLF
jgi:REP element-mobilizing transposase RayT